MDALLSFFQGFTNLGAAVMLPVVIAILGIFFRMKIGQAIKSGLLVGIGFQGLCLAVNLLTSTIQPVMDYYEQMGSGYDVLEIGFAALGGAAWTVPFAVFAIPAIVLINLVLVRFKITKVLNVDIWNFMHFLVPGALAYALCGNALVGFLVTIALSVVTLFFSQWAAPKWGEFYGLEGTTCTTLAFAAWIYPISVLINKIIDLIPGLNKLDLDMDKLGSKLGVFGDPAVIGLVVGAFLSVLTRQSISSTCTIMMGVAAVMVLIPRMVSIMMEGLTPLGSAANEYMKKKIGDDADIYIGMDIALGLGDPACITCTAIMIPLTIAMAFIIPAFSTRCRRSKQRSCEIHKLLSLFLIEEAPGIRPGVFRNYRRKKQPADMLCRLRYSAVIRRTKKSDASVFCLGRPDTDLHRTARSRRN